MSASVVPVLRAKPGVRFDVIAPAGFRILAALESVAVVLSIDLEITCGTEGHAPSDPHTLGSAYDISVRGLEVATIVNLYRALARELGPLFTVLFEVPSTEGLDPQLVDIAYVNAGASGPHIHTQPRKGLPWPPVRPGASS